MTSPNLKVFPSGELLYFLDTVNSCFISVDTDLIINLNPTELEFFKNVKSLKDFFPFENEESRGIK